MNWRSWRLTHRLAGQAYGTGIISGAAYTGGRVEWVRFRGRRVYVLWLKREAWGHPWHFVRAGHWPLPVWMGMCGKCAPWPCCGAVGYDHEPDCEGAA